jgi:hypothetical protein
MTSKERIRKKKLARVLNKNSKNKKGRHSRVLNKPRLALALRLEVRSNG